MVCPPNLEEYKYIGGIDEVGRGCLAGPVVSALVILPKDFECELINDSKKLTPKKREEAYKIILESAIDYSVQSVSVKLINKLGIDRATFLSMERCVETIELDPDYLLIDGNRWDGYDSIPYETVVKGDATYMAIAAASIVAKVRRDAYMVELSKTHPHYNWESNKGYYCKKHKEGLLEFGGTDYHRTLFIRNHIKL